MKCCLEWKTQQKIDVIPGNFFESIVLAGEDMYIATAGRDDFQLAGLIMPCKRFAGFGRSKIYLLQDMPAGLEAIEAVPSPWVDIEEELTEVAFKISTNIILDPGQLASCLSLHIEKEDGVATNIMLNRPDVRIDWQSRGIFIVSIGRM